MDQVSPNELLRHLVANRELVTYMSAHEALFGPVSPWLHAHTQRVVGAALGSDPKTVEGLRVRLDAFVVNAASLRPAGRHFVGKDYTEKDWLSKFAAWDLCAHPPRKIREGR